MNVLSLFDGMSCGQIALNRAGIKYENYFASEIDKYAIQITKKNYPNTIQIGDVTKVFAKDLPNIDLLIGGSPCQGFSIAGKQLNFNDERSKLFFEYVRLLKECKPKYFLLENVKMKKEYEKVITEYLGVQPIEINSSLVSAQNRKRLYWTNIGLQQNDLFGYAVSVIEQPKDKGILLKDILENEENVILEDFYINRDIRIYKDKAPTIRSDRTGLKVVDNIYPSKGQNGNIYDTEGKSPSLSSGNGVIGRGIGSSNSPKIVLNENQLKKFNALNIKNDKSGCLTEAMGRAGSSSEYVSSLKKIESITGVIRRLTPKECERLQTVPDDYTDCVSNTQRYKTLGNGWTIDVIVHFFSYLKF